MFFKEIKNKDGKTKEEKIGHTCIIEIKKSPSEKTSSRVEYPILYKRTNGNSIWIEKEIIDQSLFWGYIIRSGAWFKWELNLLEELRKINPDTPPQIQGEKTLVEFLEGNKEITDFLYKKIVDSITSLKAK
jgi:hypothetical protein